MTNLPMPYLNESSGLVEPKCVPQMSKDSIMDRLRSTPTLSAPVTPPDDDDLLREILLRLPPQPSSIPRASLVCKRWRRLVSDPRFLRRFRAFHRKPPLLGFFTTDSFIQGFGEFSFTPTLDPPDRIPESRFSLPRRPGDRCRFLGCHHGLALLINLTRREAVVWDPVTGDELCVPFPPGFENDPFHGSVMRAAGNDGHLSPFKLVLGYTETHTSAFFCLYESESGVWGNIISTTITSRLRCTRPSILVGNALCWLHWDGNILEFDLDRQSLAVIDKPADANVITSQDVNVLTSQSSFQIVRTEESGLGLAVLTELSIKLWERKANSDGVVRWLLQKTVQLDKLLSLGLPSESARVRTVGFDEDNNVILLYTVVGVFMVQLESLRFRNLSNISDHASYYPYTNFYTAEKNGSKKEINTASK